MKHAQFDERDHCTEPGWATWGLRQNFIQRICPHWITAPIPQNDYCPQAHARCRICRTSVHWFNNGTHHFGSINRYFADLGRTVPMMTGIWPSRAGEDTHALADHCPESDAAETPERAVNATEGGQ